MYHQELVIVDVETTGLSPFGGDRIIEIAALKIKDLKPVGQFYSLINPRREISWGAYRVNGISQDMVASAPVADIVMPQFLKFLGKSNVVGHNVKFDLGFLMHELLRLNLNLKKGLRAHDTMQMARRTLPGLASYSLANVARCLNIITIQQHRAMADVHLTFEVFNRLVTRAKQQPLSLR